MLNHRGNSFHLINGYTVSVKQIQTSWKAGTDEGGDSFELWQHDDEEGHAWPEGKAAPSEAAQIAMVQAINERKEGKGSLEPPK